MLADTHELVRASVKKKKLDGKKKLVENEKTVFFILADRFNRFNRKTPFLKKPEKPTEIGRAHV